MTKEKTGGMTGGQEKGKTDISSQAGTAALSQEEI
jgi:hypothetical protein